MFPKIIFDFHITGSLDFDGEKEAELLLQSVYIVTGLKTFFVFFKYGN